MTEQTSLEKFCEPNKDFKNIYNLTEQDFLIVSIANKIQTQLQYERGIMPTDTTEQIIKRKTGQCETYSKILSECLSLNKIKHEIVEVEPDKNFHAFIQIDNRILDPTLDTESMVYLFKDGEVIINYWVALNVGYILKNSINNTKPLPERFLK